MPNCEVDPKMKILKSKKQNFYEFSIWLFSKLNCFGGICCVIKEVLPTLINKQSVHDLANDFLICMFTK